MYYTVYEVLHTASRVHPIVQAARYYSSNLNEATDFVRIMTARHPNIEYKIIAR